MVRAGEAEVRRDSDKKLLCFPSKFLGRCGAEIVPSEPSGILEEHQASEPWCSQLLLIQMR